MIVYADTSSLVKIYLNEPGAETVREVIERALAVATSPLTYVEAVSVFARRRRNHDLTPEMAALAGATLDVDWPRFLHMDLDREAAARLASTHCLRAADAVHLAAACGVRDAVPAARVVLLSHDRQLRAAASREGLDIAPAEI